MIIVPKRTIVHPCLDDIVVKDVHNIHRNNLIRNQESLTLQRHTICFTHYDHDYILDEIRHRDKIEHEINISV